MRRKHRQSTDELEYDSEDVPYEISSRKRKFSGRKGVYGGLMDEKTSWPGRTEDNTDDSDSEDVRHSEESEGESSDDGSDNDSEKEIPLGKLIAMKQDGNTFGQMRRNGPVGRMKARSATRLGPSDEKRVLNRKSRDITSHNFNASRNTDNGEDGDEHPMNGNGLLEVKGNTPGHENECGHKKKKHKHQPSEISSKKRPSILRDTMQLGKREIRDPRFYRLTAGDFKDDAFKRRYAFVFDEKLPEEKAELKELIKKSKSEHTKARLKSQLSRVVQQMKSEEIRRRRLSLDEKEHEKRRNAIAAGKKPYYLKKSERRKQELIAKFEELKSTGKLEQYMEKRRKKNASKDHRYLPARRSADS